MRLRSAILCCLPLTLSASAWADDAEALLAKMHEAYAAAPCLTVVDTMSFQQAGLPAEEVAMTITVDAKGNGQMDTGDFLMTFIDGVLYASTSENTQKYAKIPCQATNLYDAMMAEAGGAGIPSSLVLRYSTDSKDWLNAMSLWILQDGSAESVEDVEVDGTSMQRLTIKGDAGTIGINVDAKTNLIVSMAGELTPPGAPAGFTISLGITSDIQIVETLATPIAFDAGKRTEVDSIEALFDAPQQQGASKLVKVGDAAPDFTLNNLSGESVQLATLKGSVVVMDFWATWCGPCKMALPMLQEFADWAEEEKLKVKVFAVDIWERGGSEESVTATVKKFWESKKYTIPVLMAHGQLVPSSYGLTSIPLTVVVGTDGAVVAVHSGYSPGMVDELKKDVQKALKSSS